MTRNLLILYAVAGLFISALASLPADLATPAKRLDGRHPDPERARMLATKSMGVVLPPGIDVNRVMQQVRHGPISESLPGLDADPFTGHDESMPAPTVVPTSYAGNQGYSSVAFDNDTTYLVVWADQFGTSSSGIFGARVTKSGTVLDWNGGILISGAAYAQENPSVAYDGTNYLVTWQDARNWSSTHYDIYGARVNKAGVVLDASGKVITNCGFKRGPNTAKLDATGLARGVYFVKVEGESDTKTTKVIIE